MQKDFINIGDFTAEQLQGLIDRAIADKVAFRAGSLQASLERKTLAMFFEKPSCRTRVSFEAAMTHLGGHALYLTQADIGIGSREPVQDVARVLGRMCDGIMARTFSHELVEGLAEHSPAPVINALTDYSHPCQAMADIMAAQEIFGDLTGRTLVFVGDGNNVARSLAMLCGKLGMRFVLSAPDDYRLDSEFLAQLRLRCPDADYQEIADPAEAVANAAVIYTDTWISMGQEEEKAQRIRDFKGYQINEALMAYAPSDAVVMHCLPAYRGLELTEDILEAHAATIFEEAENRLHFQRTLLAVLLGEGGIA